VRTILDLDGTNTKIYEALYAMTQDWATKLISVDAAYADIPLGYDRVTGAIGPYLGDLAAAPGEHEETFHFVLNNYVEKDNRIPTYRMDYAEARRRNALPVPETQYLEAGATEYNHWDDVPLTLPDGATYATIDLLYQPTSWEYIQFLYLANTGTIAFLADEGAYLLEAWVNTGMAEPHVMASATWGTPPTGGCDGDEVCDPGEDCDTCPSDCISGGGAPVCGNGVCEPLAGEDCLICPADCAGKQGGNPSRQFCCGDGNGANPVGCDDSRCTTEGFSCSDVASDPYCCGDTICEGAEDVCSCSIDCGAAPATETSCTDGVDNDCDGLIDCADGDCDGDPACACTPSGGACVSHTECCSNNCKKNGTCR
jgi:hypothetical protein